MGQGDGGHRYCPTCRQIKEIRVFPGSPQIIIGGLHAKKRKVICGIDAQGSNGCGTTWYTLEIEESVLNRLLPKTKRKETTISRTKKIRRADNVY